WLNVKKKKKAPDKPASVLVDFGDGEDTVEDSQIGTEAFVKPGSRRDDSSYEGPAPDDYAEKARPRIASHGIPTAMAKGASGGFDTDEPSEDSTMTPAEVLRARKPPVRRAIDELPSGENSEPSIVLETKDLVYDGSVPSVVSEPSRDGFPRGFAPTFDTEDGED